MDAYEQKDELILLKTERTLLRGRKNWHQKNEKVLSKKQLVLCKTEPLRDFKEEQNKIRFRFLVSMSFVFICVMIKKQESSDFLQSQKDVNLIVIKLKKSFSKLFFSSANYNGEKFVKNESKKMPFEFICVSSNNLDKLLSFAKEISEKQNGFVMKILYNGTFLDFGVFLFYMGIYQETCRKLVQILSNFLYGNLNFYSILHYFMKIGSLDFNNFTGFLLCKILEKISANMGQFNIKK